MKDLKVDDGVWVGLMFRCTERRCHHLMYNLAELSKQYDVVMVQKTHVAQGIHSGR